MPEIKRYYYARDYRAGITRDRVDYSQSYDVFDRQNPVQKMGTVRTLAAAQVIVEALNSRSAEEPRVGGGPVGADEGLGFPEPEVA